MNFNRDHRRGPEELKSLANAFELVENDDDDDSDSEESEEEESEEEDLEEAPLDLLDDAITTTTVEMTEVSNNNEGSQNYYYTTTARGKGGALDLLDDARHEDHSVGTAEVSDNNVPHNHYYNDTVTANQNNRSGFLSVTSDGDVDYHDERGARSGGFLPVSSGQDNNFRDERNGLVESYSHESTTRTQSIFSDKSTLTKVLLALVVALAIDVIALSTYVFEQSPTQLRHRNGGDSNATTKKGDYYDDDGLGLGGWVPLPSKDSVLNRIVFGSGSDQTSPLPYWDTVAALQPDLVIMGGDTIEDGQCTDKACSKLDLAYVELLSKASFLGAKTMLPIVATLNTHDYGTSVELSNEFNPHKKAARSLFLDFFDIDEMDERSQRKDDGLYTSYEWGPYGERVQLIVLDTRYHLTPFVPTDEYGAAGKERFVPTDDKGSQIMSENQWEWLEAQLVRPANVRLVVSAFPVLPMASGYDCWRMMTHEQTRLHKILKDLAMGSAIVFLTSDNHRRVGGFYQDDDNPDVHELMASSWTVFPDSCAQELCHLDENDDKLVNGLVHNIAHFGTIDIDWMKHKVTLSLLRSDTQDPIDENNPQLAGKVLQQQSYRIP
eukprot:scaffold48361_cov49-Attheya_sp.AAC.1